MIEEWKKIFQEHHLLLTPNRKTGLELDQYFQDKYPYEIFDSARFKKIVKMNITENEHSLHKLPNREKMDIRTYRIKDVLIGIEISSGEFHIECEDIEKTAFIYDDLFLYRGLDVDDLNNYFLVAEYVKLQENE